MTKSTSYPCPECHVGAMRPKTAPFFTLQADQPVSVPAFPVWACDVCGRREYDHTALAQLRAMLQPRRGRVNHEVRSANGRDQARPGPGAQRPRRAP